MFCRRDVIDAGVKVLMEVVRVLEQISAINPDDRLSVIKSSPAHSNLTLRINLSPIFSLCRSVLIKTDIQRLAHSLEIFMCSFSLHSNL